MNEKKRPPKKTILLWQLRLLLLLAIILAVAAYFTMSFRWFFVPVATFVIAYLVLAFWYIPRYFSLYTIEYSDGAVIINRGVLIKTTHIMPFSRLIYIKTITSPLARSFSLSAISLKAARTAILIPELETEEAEALARLIKGGEND